MNSWISTSVFGHHGNIIIGSCTEKTVSLIYGERENFFELKKVLLIQKFFFLSKEIDLFTWKKIFLNQQNFLQFKEIFSLSVYQKNVSGSKETVFRVCV